MAPGWRPYGTVYGPVFTLASAQGMKAAGDSALRARLFFQLLAALAVAAAMALVWRRTRDAGAVAFVGLNPVLAVGVVNGGHNDVLVGLAVLAGVLVAMDDRPAMAGLLLGTGALVKVVVVLPVLALAWRSRLSMLALAHASLLLLAYDDRYTVVAHRTLLHRLLYDLWARALPALEVAAIATLVAVSAVRLARRPRARFGLGI